MQVSLLGLGVARAGGAVEEEDLVGPVVYAVSQDVDYSPVSDFTLQTGQEPASGVVMSASRESSAAVSGWVASRKS